MRQCTGANPQPNPTRSATTVVIYTIYCVKPTAKDASGHGHRLIRSLGSLLKLPAAAKPPTLKRPFGGTTAPILPMGSADRTAESVAGLGMLPTQISGLVRLPLADAETGGIDLYMIEIKPLCLFLLNFLKVL